MELNLYCNSIGDRGATALAEALRQGGSLTYLNVGWNNIGDRGAKALAGALEGDSKLETLVLQKNMVRDPGAVAIAGALKVNRSLSNLEIAENMLDRDGIDALLEVLMEGQIRLDIVPDDFDCGISVGNVDSLMSVESVDSRRPSKCSFAGEYPEVLVEDKTHLLEGHN